jgi:predicted phage terminase large subunit-like protein
MATPDQERLDWIAAEVRREQARRRLINFCQYIDPNYQASAAHRTLAEALEKVERGEINRLILNWPRRHGKSRLVSQMFPCFALGRNPQLRFVQTGYAESLTVEHSRKARDILASNRFNEVFPDVHHNPATAGQQMIATARQTAHEWGTTKGGTYYAVGVGGGLSGRGFHIGLIDDPLKDRPEANSKVKRDRVWDWYRSAFYPAQDSDEIRHNAAIIICMTRWHVDDLTARVRTVVEDMEDKLENWTVISMPACSDDQGNACDFTNETAKALWPERYPLRKLKRIREVVGSQEFSAQFQQSPRAEDGAALDSGKLQMINADQVPDLLMQCRMWDLAFTDTKSSDFVAGMRMGVDADGDVYLLHLKRFKGRWLQAEKGICAQAETDGLEVVQGIECNGTQSGYYDIIKEQVPTRTILPLIPKGNKEMRASAWGTRLQDKKIYCVRGDWNQTLFDEMDFFPNSEHDDIVDSVSHGWEYLKMGANMAQIVDHAPEGYERYDHGKFNRLAMPRL